MLLFDAHLDIAWNALEWGRDLRLPVAQIRQGELGLEGPGRSRNTVSIPELHRAEVGLFIATVLPRVIAPGEPPFRNYASPEAAYAAAVAHLTYYRLMCERGYFRHVTNGKLLRSQIEVWRQGAGAAPLGFILSIEGADAVLEPSQLEEWFEAGLRIVGPVHFGPNQYAHGTGSEGGLFPAGRELLQEMQRLGLILDVTHLTDEGFWEALELFEGPVLSSHHNCRALVPGQRQIADEQIRALIEKDAVIGIAFDAWMLYPGWEVGVSTPDLVRIEAAADHIDHICQLAGNSAHVGIGSDLDGGFGTEQCPGDLETIVDVQSLVEILDRRGYRREEVEQIMHSNWIRFFLKAWDAPERFQPLDTG